MIKDHSLNKVLLSLFGIVLINFLFAFKYLNRISDFSLVISFIYIVVLFIGYKILNKQDKDATLFKRSIFFILLTFFIIVSGVIFKFIQIETLNVDRWSVISSFWDTASKGENPYSAISHMGNKPGPLPVYFILTWPFLKINELGWFTITGIILFVILIKNVTSNKKTTITLYLLITSIGLIWEIITRSTIFTNSVLFLLAICYALNVNLLEKKHLLLSAIIIGLLLSTRTIFIFPLLILTIFFLHKQKYTLSRILIWYLIISIVFVLSFLPIIISFGEEFFHSNPFSVQSQQLFPIYLTPILIIITFLFGYMTKNKTEVILYLSLSLITIFIVYFIYITSITTLEGAFFQSKADISYSIFALPFFIYYIALSGDNSELIK